MLDQSCVLCGTGLCHHHLLHVLLEAQDMLLGKIEAKEGAYELKLNFSLYIIRNSPL
jgi:hypothetical protein